MYHTKPKSRGIYQSNKLIENKLIAMAAEGTEPGDISTMLNKGLEYQYEAERLKSKVEELERQLAFYRRIQPYVDGIVDAAHRGAFA